MSLLLALTACGVVETDNPTLSFEDTSVSDTAAAIEDFDATIGERSACPLGYDRLEATGDTMQIHIEAECHGGGSVSLVFSPTPAPGHDAPCDRFRAQVQTEQDCVETDGVLTLTEVEQGFWVEGGCLCKSENFADLWAAFSLPMRVDG